LPTEQITLSIIVPCHNSEKFIRDTIGLLLLKLKSNEELILIENGSTDNTWNYINQLYGGMKFPNIILMQSNKGLGFALRLGIKESRGSKIVFMADDLPFGMQELNLARTENSKISYFIISKYNEKLGNFNFRNLQGFIFIRLRELILESKVQDSQATFYGDAALIKRIANYSQEKNFLITLELIVIARLLEIKIIEVPAENFTYKMRPTTVHFYDPIKMFFGLFKIKSRMKFVKKIILEGDKSDR
jgi:glycosyltransferase involved in cell wall biosynthesis